MSSGPPARFDFVVSLRLEGRRAVVLGGGAEAVERAERLLQAGADVEVYAADPADQLAELPVVVHRRTYRRGDLQGAFIAVATLEDDADIAAAWDEAEQHGVLFSALDDIPHCHFASPALIRHGDLSVTVSTAGRAPALSKRLRRQLETEIGAAHGQLVDVLAEARQAALPRTVPFAEWAGRWGRALADLDGLVDQLRRQGPAAVRDRVLAALRGEAPAAEDRARAGSAAQGGAA